MVDDDAAVREIMRRSIEREGRKVVEAHDGVRALEPVAGPAPDLIVLDLAMPRMDGFEFLEQLRESDRTGDVPVVVLTAKDMSLDERADLSGYVEHVIRKTTTPAR